MLFHLNGAIVLRLLYQMSCFEVCTRSNKERLLLVQLKGSYEPLQIGGAILQIDTTNFAQVEYNKVIEGVRAALRL